MRSSIRYLLSLFLIFSTAAYVYADTASILPPAKTTFFDQNGKPLTSGKVYFYIPGTTTLKTTWQDAAETIPNTNPVILDAAGRGIILGSGSYRQIVKDKNDNQVWDQVTSNVGGGGGGGTTVGDGLAVGTILLWPGLVAPTNYSYGYGQELSRTTYSALLAAFSQAQSVTCTSGSPILTSIADTSQINFTTTRVESPCISGSAQVISKTVNSITLNANAIVSTTTTATAFLYGNGNGVTTFNLPDFRGVVPVGRCNMGGANCANITTAYYTDPNSTGGGGGSQSSTLLGSNLPAYTPGGTIVVNNGIITITNGAITINNTGFIGSSSAAFNSTAGTTAPSPAVASAFTASQATTTASQATTTAAFTGTAQGGSSTAFGNIPPSKTVNYIIKVLPDINIAIAHCADLLDAGTACTANTGTSGHTLPYLDAANSWSALQTFSSVAISSGTITGMPNPVLASDVANKAYVDSLASGLNVLASSALATAAVLPNTPTYANGASGVGATLTAGSNTTLTVDGTAAPLNTVVLVKNQASAFQNGIYTVTTAGSGAAAWVLTRATYFDQAAEMKAGSYTFISSGTTNINTAYTLQAAVATVGTDPSNWALFSRTSANLVFTAVSGTNTTYSSTQCNSTVSRSNAGTVMVDTIPGTGTAVLPSSCSITITNNDASAILAINVAAGATIKANLAATGYIYLCPQQSLSFYSDGSNYFATNQPNTCPLQASTVFYASPTGSATNHGLTSAAPIDSITGAYNLVRQVVTSKVGVVITVQSANGTYTTAQIIEGLINGQQLTDTQSNLFPVIIQGDTVTPTNVFLNNNVVPGVGTCCDAMTVTGGASVLVQGFKFFSANGNGIITNSAKTAIKSVVFLAAGVNHINSTHHSFVEIAGNYTIQGDASGHWLVSDGSSIYIQTATTVTVSGAHSMSTGIATGQYSGSNIIFNAALTWAGSALSGNKCVMTLNAVLSGLAFITQGSGTSTSGGGQCT